MNLFQKIFIILLPLPFTTLGLNFLTFSGNYIPEIFFLFFIFLYFLIFRNSVFFKIVLLNKYFLISFFILMGVSTLSLIHQDFDIINFYGRFRAILFSIITFFIVRSFTLYADVTRLEKNIILFTTSASIMYLLNAILYSQEDNSKIGMSMLCFSIGVCLSLEKGFYKLSTALVILSAFVAYLSFFRQNYFIAFYLLLLYSIFIFKPEKGLKFDFSKKIITPIIFYSASIIFIIFNINYFIEFLSSNESRYIQSIGKMTDLLEGNYDESAHLRVQSYNYLIENFIYFILPNGLVNDSILVFRSIWGGTISHLNMSITRDSVLAYLVVNFGFLFLFLFLFLFFSKLVKSFSINFRKTITRFLFLFPLLITVFFLDGATLTQLQKSVFFGMALGLILYVGKESENFK